MKTACYFILTVTFVALAEAALISITTSEQEWFPVGQDATMSCVWTYDESIKPVTEDTIIWKSGEQRLIQIKKNDSANSYIYPVSAFDQRIENKTEFTESGAGGNGELTILDFGIEDAEEYKCEVTVRKYSSTGTMQVRAYSDPSVYIQDIRTTVDIRTPIMPTVPENETVTTAEPEIGDNNIIVKCIAEQAYPEPTQYDFFIDGSEPEDVIRSLTPTDSVICYASGDMFDCEAELTIPPLKEYNGKAISCRVVLPSQTKTVSNDSSSTIEILHETSEVVTTLEPSTAVVGDTVKIICQADGNPAPFFRVWLDEQPGFDEQSDNVFVLNNVTVSSAVDYRCVAIPIDGSSEDQIESEESKYLTVHYMGDPILKEGENDIYKDIAIGEIVTKRVRKGEDYSLTCEADGTPTPTIMWTKNGKNPLYSAVRSINNAEYSDSGLYKCTVSSPDTSGKIAEKSKSVRIEVEGGCEATFKEPQITSSQSEHFRYKLKLECVVTGQPACKVNIVQQSNLTPRGNFSASTDGSTYTMTFNALQNFTEPVSFFCTARNDFGFANKTITMDESTDLCCEKPKQGGLGTGAVIGIILLVLVIVVGIPVACYFVKKRNAQPKKKAPNDAEAAEPEKEGLNKDASSERSPEEP